MLLLLLRRGRPDAARNPGDAPALSQETMMTIDWTAFTPWSALAGGVLIGVAAAMFVLLNGRSAGISGILGGQLKPVTGDIT